MSSSGAAIVLLVGLSASLLARQSQEPRAVFRVDVDLVEVDAIVTDAQGNSVTDLSAADFEVFEDGVAQEIVAFSTVNIPIDVDPSFASASVPRIEPDVQSNVADDGRIYLIVLDDVLVGADWTLHFRNVARSFVEQYLGPNDVAAVTYVSGRPNDGQDFTNNRTLILSAIQKYTPGHADGNPDLAVMRSLRMVAEFMSGVRGRRKAILFFSNGSTTETFNVTEQSFAPAATAGRGSGRTTVINNFGQLVEDERRKMIAAATRSNIVIYSIDPRGLTTPIDGTSAASADGGGTRSVQSALRGFRMSEAHLRTIAEDTGGFALTTTNEFSGGFDRIVRENSAYHVLGYYPRNTRRDGQFRRIEVRVKRSGLAVRARSGYTEPLGRRVAVRPPMAGDDPLRAVLNEAVGSPLPLSGLPLRVFASPRRGSNRTAVVALIVEVDTTNVRFFERAGMLASRIDVSYVATDPRSSIRGSNTHTATMQFRPTDVDEAKKAGFRFVSQIDLAPGRYQLRVGAVVESGQVGTVIYDVDVPDFARAPLSMSVPVLSTPLAARTPTARPKDPFNDLLSATPTAARTFTRDDTLVVATEFYENLPNLQTHMFELSATVRAGNRVVFEDFDSRSSAQLPEGRGGHHYTATIPISRLDPGRHVLRIEGRARAGDQPTIGRDIEFVVNAD